MATDRASLLSALDPDSSVVVEACAGSGKTWLLVSRVIRLLLAGVAPGEILAITFTRKGAREMQERLSAWLEELATDSDDERISVFLRERGLPDRADLLPASRGLFEKVLAAQPGIKINTFHGWFADLVQRAPLQAGIAKGFTLIEAVSGLQQEAWQRYAQGLTASGQNEQQTALDSLFAEYGMLNTRKLVQNFLAKRAEWWRFTAGEQDPVRFAIAQLAGQSKIDLGVDYAAAMFADMEFNRASSMLTRALQSGGKTQHALVVALEQTTAIASPTERLAALMPLIFTKTNSVRDALVKFCAKSGDQVAAVLNAVSMSLSRTQNYLIEQRVLQMNAAAFTAGQGLLEQYQQLKAERGLMDFTDIEYAAYSLIRHCDHAEYMQYKLDSRYRHVLLDEFQDTNPLQWMTLQAWLQASSDAGLKPTVFLVGDPKQSIFHFRRADARLFAHAADFLRREYGARVLGQNVSRRSATAVLSAVNDVFAKPRQLSGFVPHQAYDEHLPGEVYRLPLPETAQTPTDKTSSPPALRDLLTHPQLSEEDLRRAQEADVVANGIKTMVESWLILDGEKLRPADYCDVMILTRGRKQLRSYELALRAAGVPYASARHGGLLACLEVQDLLALLQFLLRPSDDLSLVHLLRAPYFACSDDDLILLAQHAGGNWWQRMNELDANVSPALIRARACLARWLQLAPHLPVHDLLDRIYFEAELEQRYARAVPAAMRPAVQANLLAFMEISLTLDSGRYPSLGRFLADLKALQNAPDVEAPDEGTLVEIGNAVRILTIHGAKGLEAPIVWIIDATIKPKSSDPYDVLVNWPTGAEQPLHFSFVTTKSERGGARETFFDEEKRILEQEDANLLYVAMTRAKQYLIVSGNQVGSGAGSWYESLAEVLPAGDLSKRISRELNAIPPPTTKTDRAALAPPGWITAIMPYGQRKEISFDKNRDYGIKLHALLETARDGEIPAGPAQVLLGNVDASLRELLLQHAQAILRAPHLRKFFDPRQYRAARNEIGVIDVDGEPIRLDRVVEFDDEVWVLDYKSGSSETVRGSAFVADYRAQLQRYRTTLARIYTNKRLRCGLIFGDAVFEEIA